VNNPSVMQIPTDELDEGGEEPERERPPGDGPAAQDLAPAMDDEMEAAVRQP